MLFAHLRWNKVIFCEHFWGLNEVSVLSSLRSQMVASDTAVRPRLKSIAHHLISFSLTAHPLELHKIQAPSGSSLPVTETRATSGTSARLLMQQHNVTSRLFSLISQSCQESTEFIFCWFTMCTYLVFCVERSLTILILRSSFSSLTPAEQSGTIHYPK